MSILIPLKSKSRSHYEDSILEVFQTLDLLRSFDKLAQLGLPGAIDDLINREMHTHEVFSRLTKAYGSSKPTKSKKNSALRKRLKADALRVFGSINAAKIIFAHSMLDSLVTECCRISIYAEPNAWIRDLKMKVPLLLVEGTLPKRREILWKSLHNYIRDLERENLVRRIHRIQKVCAPVCKGRWSKFEPDFSKLQSFDSARHKFIHRKGLLTPSLLELESREVFKKTAFYLLCVLNTTYSFRLTKKISQTRLIFMQMDLTGESNDDILVS